MANTTASKKAKGTRLEKHVAKRMNQILGDYGVDTKRMPMSGAIEHWKSDIYTTLPVSIECKNQEKWTVHKWWEQCVNDAGLGKMPILVMSRNYMVNDPLVMLKFEDLLFLMELAVQSGWVSYIKKGRRPIK